MPVAPDLQPFLDAVAASQAPAIQDGTPAQAREAFDLLARLRRPDQEVPGVATETDEVAGCPARVYRAEAAGSTPVPAPGPTPGPTPGPPGALPTMLFLHGGGFVIGGLDTHDALCRLLARECGVVVVAVDYPLAPEHPFPAAPDVAVRAMREVAERRAAYGGGRALAVGGDSAGACLSAVVAQQCRDLEIAGQLLLYPVVDPYGEWASREENATGYYLELAGMAWFQHQYAGDRAGDVPDPRMAPLHGDLVGVAPACVATAEMDPLRDEGEAYAEALAAAGVTVDQQRYDGQVHGFANFDFLAESSRTALLDCLTRFRALLEG